MLRFVCFVAIGCLGAKLNEPVGKSLLYQYNSGMKILRAVIIVWLFAVVPLPVMAKDDPFIVTSPTQPKALGAVTTSPRCFNVINKAPYSVYGSIHTNFFIREDGIKTRHRSNFRLKPDAYAQFCTSGPFYDGEKIELVLRTLVPLFSCKTAIYGDILIKGRRKPEGGTETWAECL